MLAKKDILHVVVGAGFPRAFANAVRSVLSRTPDDVLAIYNAVDTRDARGFEELELDQFGKRLTVEVRDNAPDHQKIGGLFSAYNYAIAFATGRYRYMSLIQGDMQMIKTTGDRIELLDATFSSTSAKVFFVNTAITAGLLHDGVFDGVWSSENQPSFDLSTALTAVGVLNLELVASENFRFERDEASTAKEMHQRGYVMATVGSLIDLAFNPWPGTVRKGIRRGADVPNGHSGEVLKLIRKSGSEKPFQIGRRQVSNLVVPSGFRTLYPYWASDLLQPKWISRRREATKRLGIGFFAGIDGNGEVTSYLMPSRHRRRPGLTYVFWMLLRGLAVGFYRRQSLGVYSLLRKQGWFHRRRGADSGV